MAWLFFPITAKLKKCVADPTHSISFFFFRLRSTYYPRHLITYKERASFPTLFSTRSTLFQLIPTITIIMLHLCSLLFCLFYVNVLVKCFPDPEPCSGTYDFVHDPFVVRNDSTWFRFAIFKGKVFKLPRLLYLQAYRPTEALFCPIVPRSHCREMIVFRYVCFPLLRLSNSEAPL